MRTASLFVNSQSTQPVSSLRWLTQFGVYTAAPWAFLTVIIYAIAWAVFGRLDFSSFATLAVWIMTLFIQRAQHRDTQAIHAKLDELLRVNNDARAELTQLDEEEPEEIEKFRKVEQQSTAAK
jgi:low affinity Fe/Cu permease